MDNVSRYFETTQLPADLSRELFAYLGSVDERQQPNVSWHQAKFMGHPRPRREAWFKRTPNSPGYRYSNTGTLPTSVMPAALQERVFKWAEDCTGEKYNGMLVNEYPHSVDATSRGYGSGSSNIAAHSDDEHKSYLSGTIISMSLGAPRTFRIREIATGVYTKMALVNGTVVLMKPGSQERFTHEIVKQTAAEKRSDPTQYRYNITIRPECPCGLVRCLLSSRVKKPSRPICEPAALEASKDETVPPRKKKQRRSE